MEPPAKDGELVADDAGEGEVSGEEQTDTGEEHAEAEVWTVESVTEEQRRFKNMKPWIL